MSDHVDTSRVWRTLARLDDAVAVATRAVERLGDRVWHDPLVGEGNLDVKLRDPARRGWLVPESLLLLDLQYVDKLPPESTDPEVRAIFADHLAELDAQRANMLPPRRCHAGRFVLREGGRVMQNTYGDDGWLREVMRSTPRQAGVLSVLADPDWRTLDEIVERVLAMDPTPHHAVRVHMPVPCPRGPNGAWWRVQSALDAAAFDGELSAEGGWIVADGYAGTARVQAPTFDAAVEAWRALVDDLRPLPPRPKPSPPLPPVQPDTTHTEVDEETKTTRIHMSTTIVFRPRVKLPWPDPVPEATPAVALPVPALPEPPQRWVRAGYRPVRVFGERGETGWTMVRGATPESWISVGSELLDLLDPHTLEAEIDALDEAAHAGWAEKFAPFAAGPSPWEHSTYRHVCTDASWEEDGLRQRGIGVGPKAQRPRGLGLVSQVSRATVTPAPSPDDGVVVPLHPR